jgi:hypothetical protein
MENEKVILKKIPLQLFIQVLKEVWNNGADYIDIIGVPNEVQDSIEIAVSNQESEEIDFSDKKLDEEDFNELI